MSTVMSLASTSARSISSRLNLDTFKDLPIIDRATRLTCIEMKYSDKQVVNELVYRWCRVITRSEKCSLPDTPSDNPVPNLRKVLILDMIGSVNMIRLGTVLKRDERRMRMIALCRGCKINSTYVTLSSYLGHQAHPPSALKLVVIYHDEFFIVRTLALIKDFLRNVKCHVVLIAPRLNRQESDWLNLLSNYQILKSDFCVNRRQIGPAQPELYTDSYQAYLNEIFIHRHPPSKFLPDKIFGNLQDDRLHINVDKLPKKTKNASDKNGSSVKRIKSDIETIKAL